MDNDESIKLHEGDGRHDEQIHRSCVRRMVLQKRFPTLPRWAGPSDHILGDRRLSDIETKLEKLTLNARRTPQDIFEAHPCDQRPQFWIDGRPPSKISAFPTPIPAKTIAMPAHERFWSDDSDHVEN